VHGKPSIFAIMLTDDANGVGQVDVDDDQQALRPRVTDGDAALRVHEIRMEPGSLKAVDASSNETPCLARFALSQDPR
jgi:hypothetical protein